MHKSRVQWIDGMKAFGIILVVLGHCITYLENLGHGYDLIWRYIASFNMPLFFLISGYLYRNTKKPFVQVFLGKLKSLGIPYLVATIMCIPLGWLRSRITGGGVSAR